MQFNRPVKEVLVGVEVRGDRMLLKVALIVLTTNRAWNEICEGLEEILGGSFVRIGGRRRVAEGDQVDRHPEHRAPNGWRNTYHS